MSWFVPSLDCRLRKNFEIVSSSPRNRLSPRYINIATNRYNRHAGTAAQPSPKEQKRKKRENNADVGSSTKTKMTRNRCALRVVPPHTLAYRSPAYQTTPSTRKATTTPLLPGLALGFPPIRGRDWGGGTPDALQEGRATPAGVSASVSGMPTRISPAHQTHNPESFDVLHLTSAHQHTPPRS